MSIFDKYRSNAQQTVSTGSIFDKYKKTTTIPTVRSTYEDTTPDLFTIQDFANDPDKMDALREYMPKRLGEGGLQQADESDEDYVKRFITHARRFETNSISIAGQIDYLRKAKEDDRRKFGKLYNYYEQLPSAGQQGGDTVGRATKDYLKAAILDPINLLGVGIIGRAGLKFGTALVGKNAVREGIKLMLPKTQASKQLLTGAVTGGAFGAGYNVASQDIRRKAYMDGKTPESNIELMDVAFDSIIGAGVGTAVAGGLPIIGAGIQKADEGARKLFGFKKSELDFLKKVDEEDAIVTDPVEGPAITQDQLNEAQERINLARQRLNPEQAKEKLDEQIITKQEILRQPPIVDAKVMVELSRKVAKIVENITEEERAAGKSITLISDANKNKKISDAVTDIINNIDKIDEDVLQAALRRENITENQFLDFMSTVDDFASMENYTMSEAGRTLQSKSNLGKLRNKLLSLDPELKDKLNKLYGETDEVTSAAGHGYNLLKRIDRERRALMVTQLATTARNVATGLTVVSFETMANTMEATLYHFGRAFKHMYRGGNFSPEGINTGFKDWISDSFGLAYSFVRQGMSDDISQFLLQNNPRLNKIMFRTIGEVGEDSQQLTQFAQYANILNLAQDAMFRRAFFADHVTRKLRRAGVKLEDLAVDGTSVFGKKGGSKVEAKLLKEGMEYALKNTFALHPRKGDAAYHFVKFVERFPGMPIIGTGQFPFARFMANALSFQLKYSPLNMAYGAFQGAIQGGAKAIGKATTEQAKQEARENFSKGLIGTAALMTAVYYRAKNQDTEWYYLKAPDGRKVDMRPFFPAAPYMIVADFIVKRGNNDLDKLKMKDYIDGFTGAQFRAGAASYTVDKFFEMMQSEGGFESVGQEKLGEIIGGYVGDVTAGFGTPARVVKDIVAAFDEEEAIVRDSSSIDGTGMRERAVNAFLAKLYKNAPVLSKKLPELESPTREDKILTQSPFLGQVIGLRFQERDNPVEKEITKAGIKNWQVLPSTGDKEADRLIKKELGSIVEFHLGDIVKSDFYKQKEKINKEVFIRKYLQKLRKFAKEVALAKYVNKDKPYTPFDRARWAKQTRRVRKLANQYYNTHRKGATVESLGEYRLGTEIGLFLQRLE